MRVFSDASMSNHVNGLSHVEVPQRLTAALAGVDAAERAGVPVRRMACPSTSESALTAVHDAAYLERLKGLSAAGGGYLDPDTALGPDSWKAALLAAGAAVGAVESALSGTAAFAVARPPGHHAGRKRAMGFCILNNAAIAAEHARSRGAGRIAILDWDVHHGNGTQDIFYTDGELLYLSVHQSPFYPGTGDVREVGEDAGRGLTVNVPLPFGSNEDAYAEAFTGIFFPVLREFRPELMIVSAGYDAHVADPLGGMNLETSSFGRFAAALADLAHEMGTPPLALLLEGGYDLGALTDSVAATMSGVEGPTPLTHEYTGDSESVEDVRRALAPFWASLR